MVDNLPPSEAGGVIPLTLGQQEFLDDHGLTFAEVRIGFAYNLSGQVDHTALDEAVRALQLRHEALRMRLIELDDSRFAQRITNETVGVSEIEMLPEGVDASILAFHRRPLDLRTGAPMRVGWIDAAEGGGVLAITIAHLVLDLPSHQVIETDLWELYALEVGAPCNPLEPLRTITEIVREESDAGDELVGGEAEFWREVAEFTMPLAVPLPHAGRQEATPTISIELSEQKTTALLAHCAAIGVMPIAVFLSAISVSLMKMSDPESACFEILYDGRRRGYGRTVGFFLRIMDFQATVNLDDDFDEICRAVMRRWFQLLKHAAPPYAKFRGGERLLDPMTSLAGWPRPNARVNYARATSDQQSATTGILIKSVQGTVEVRSRYDTPGQLVAMPGQSVTAPLTRGAEHLFIRCFLGSTVSILMPYDEERFDSEWVKGVAAFLAASLNGVSGDMR